MSPPPPRRQPPSVEAHRLVWPQLSPSLAPFSRLQMTKPKHRDLKSLA